MNNPARTMVRSNERFVIVRWDAIPPIAPVPSFHVKIHATNRTRVFPTFAEAAAFAELASRDEHCPLLDQVIPDLI